MIYPRISKVWTPPAPFAYLASPAHPQMGPLLYHPSALLGDFLHQAGYLCCRRRWVGWALEKLAQLLALFFVVGWKPFQRGWFAIEVIWDEDLVLMVLIVGMGEDISTLAVVSVERFGI